MVEHAVVNPRRRSRGIGSQMVAQLASQSRKPVVAEVEPPVDEMSRRRMAFWIKAGFAVNRFDYIQPAYSKTKKPVAMVLMSYPAKLTRAQFEGIRNQIHLRVYGCQKPVLKI